ncbi:polyhydroxyalkanoate depolymerase [Rhizobacter sp. Root404]|uniref:polyhydroxyalkanoate depolymerase n=1 Tax=Rhizobacter sp. Root404 TaxID=1736528 RepID=UPI0006FB80EB|nr:polyhydroxyalkanoate depolymerase [Rhizobacter sp. Root404]KQW36303.1 poly(3-hydroxybutyrate) depolymerase [Rhizobacter sp. Root404]
MMYQAYQAQSDLMWPLRTLAKLSVPMLQDSTFGFAAQSTSRQMAAACRVLELAEVTHKRPPWRIDSVMSKGESVPVVEEVVATTPFATLLRFRKPGAASQPKVLVVAPMSGHFATLLRDTVRTMLQDHDVYVTDWHNVRDVPLAAGRFGLDEYTQHLIDFIAALGPNAHVLAVCQPTVAALSAVSIMSEDQHAATPASLTLMAGPIDCRISPTEVNRLATTKPIAWFEKNLISTVPWRHGGGGRRVYPGFVQLSAFMSMNKDRHVNAFKEYYKHLVDDEFDKAEVTRTFYEEYMAVADLSADFYIETVDLVFQKYALPKGELTFRGRTVNPAAIRRTALVTIEGERDDICAIGQTLAAQDLASSLRPYMRTHYVQPNVGHYGVFSGKRWQNAIYPLVRDVIHISQ